MVNVRMLALASALLLLLPLYAWAAPDPSDPTSLLIEGGAKQLLTASNVTLLELPGQRVQDPNTTYAHERLVEGHTTFAVITVESREVQRETNFTIEAFVQCAAQAGGSFWYAFGLIPYPHDVGSSTVQCVENATMVIMSDPVPPFAQDARMSPLVPDGVVLRVASPAGAIAYETEYVYKLSYPDRDGRWHVETRYAWGVAPMPVWADASGQPKNLRAVLPFDRLEEMGVRSFRVVDMRTLPTSS
jgi:hypothetical protein